MRIFLIAGEPSGDKLGAALMAGLKQLAGDIDFSGIGGPMMATQGLQSRFDMAELSVMGLAEVLPKYRALMARINQTARAVLDQQPDVLITIDSPDFCLRVARRVKAASAIRTVHYVAPSVWAWRAGRAARMAKSIDHVLALLPFEPPYMRAVGMRCDFVGHPVVSEPTSPPEDTAAFRADNALGDAPLILVLPGSRRNEVARLAPTFGEALRPVLARHPDARVIVPAAAPVASAVIEAVRTWPGTPLVLDPRTMTAPAAEMRKRHAFAAADVALAASGTVSLELSAAMTPMVIAYDLNWLSWQIMSRMAKIDTVTLVNLITKTPAVPEFLGPTCRPGPIAAALNDLLDNPAQRAVQTRAMSRTMRALGQGATPPGLRAAQAVLQGLDLPKPAR